MMRMRLFRVHSGFTALVCLILILVIAPTAVWADDATVLEYVGKVEIKEPGGAWTSVEEGMSFSQGSTVSTGFNSSVRLDLGTSELRIKALTRMTIRELAEKEGTVTTDLYLRVGKVQAKVKPAVGLSHDFKLTSPVSTAAVRGTTFSYDGVTVEVSEGTVVLFNTVGQSRSVVPGESGKAAGSAPPVSGEETLAAAVEVSTSTSPADAGGDSGSGTTPVVPQVPTDTTPTPTTSDVDITVEW